MRDNRIILGETPEQKIRELIKNSYIPDDRLLANPILDLACIVSMARQIEVQKLLENRNELTNRLLGLIKEII